MPAPPFNTRPHNSCEEEAMARIRVLQAVSGMEHNWSPGDLVDLPGEEAAKWADGVRAELVRDEETETPEGGGSPEKTTARTRTRTRKES